MQDELNFLELFFVTNSYLLTIVNSNIKRFLRRKFVSSPATHISENKRKYSVIAIFSLSVSEIVSGIGCFTVNIIFIYVFSYSSCKRF